MSNKKQQPEFIVGETKLEAFGKRKVPTFQFKVNKAVFFWAKFNEPDMKYNETADIPENYEYSAKVLVSEEVADQFEELEINKGLKEVPSELQVPKNGASDAKIKSIEKFNKKWGLYIPYAEKAAEDGKKLFLLNLTKNYVNSKGNKNYVKVVGRNPAMGQLTEEIGGGSEGSFRIKCLKGTPGSASEDKFNVMLEVVQITKLVEFISKDHGEESMGEMGMDNYEDDDEEEGSSTENPSESEKEEEEDDGDDAFAGFGDDD